MRVPAREPEKQGKLGDVGETEKIRECPGGKAKPRGWVR